MEQEKQGYKSMETRFYQEGLDSVLSGWLSGNQWTFKVHDHTPNQEYKVVFEGNLQETIELILLGKVLKAQIQAADADAEIQGKKAAFAQSANMNICSLCGEPVNASGANPHNVCAQREAYLADRS